MRLFLLILLQAVLVTACSSPAPTPNTQVIDLPPPEAPAPQETSLEMLSSAATALQAIYDQSLEQAQVVVLECPLGGEEAMALLMPLKSRLDEKLAVEAKAYRANPEGFARAHGFATCEASCRCGTYVSLLEQTSTRTKGAHRQWLKKLSFKAQNQTPKQALKCAQDQNWFCSSELLKELRSESRANQ